MNFSDPHYIIKDNFDNSWTINNCAIQDDGERKSLYFDGVTHLTSSAIKLGGRDFTVDFWMKCNRQNANNVVEDIVQITTVLPFSWDGLISVQQYDVNKWYLTAIPDMITYNNTAYSSGNFTIDTNTYHHMAIVYIHSEPVIKYYIDGALKVSFNSNYSERDRYVILGFNNYVPANSGRHYIGWLSDFRITNGIARWTENFDIDTDI